MTNPISYTVVCCGGQALIHIKMSRWRSGSITVDVETASQTPHLTVAVAPVVDGKPLWTPEKMFAMATSSAAERQVTELTWSDGHRSWIIRCGGEQCRRQAEISNLSLHRLAEKLAEGTWEIIDGTHVVPLGALTLLLTRLNW